MPTCVCDVESYKINQYKFRRMQHISTRGFSKRDFRASCFAELSRFKISNNRDFNHLVRLFVIQLSPNLITVPTSTLVKEELYVHWFFVHSILADRYNHRREFWLVLSRWNNIKQILLCIARKKLENVVNEIVLQNAVKQRIYNEKDLF